ncbi:MAG: cobalt-zinc-cadmium efflux system protein [Bradymonadia bacterium]
MSHAHDHQGRPTPERAFVIAIVLNGAFLILEVIVGLWTNSLAILSDAGHMVSDVAGLAIALVALRLASRKPSKRYTFGLRRAPVLGGLINGAALVAIVVFISIEAVARLDSPPKIEVMPVFWTGLTGLGVNLGSAWYLARSRDRSVNTRGAMLHLLADALGSVAAIVSAIAAGLFDAPIADPIASLVIAAMILLGSMPLLRDTVAILLQRSTIDVGAARRLLEAQPGVIAVEDLHIWALDAGDIVLSAVVTVGAKTLAEANARTDEWRVVLEAAFEVRHATIECRHAAAPALTADDGY